MHTEAQSTFQPGHDKGEFGSATVASQLSGPLTALVGSAFVGGVMSGLFQFLQRSPIVHTTVNANGDVTALVDHFTSTGDSIP